MKIRFKYILSIITTLIIVVAMLFNSCDTSTEVINKNYSDYFPLKVGNKWYYSNYSYSVPPDANRIELIKEGIGTRDFSDTTYYTMRETYYNNEAVSYVDTNFYVVSGNELVCRYEWEQNTRNVITDFSMKLNEQKVFPGNEETKQYLIVKEKSETSIKFLYDHPGIVDEEHLEEYKIGRGVVDYFSYWGFGYKLIRFEEGK